MAQGADVVAVEDLEVILGGGSRAELGAGIAQADQAVGAAIDHALGDWGPLAVEVGIDYVPDPQGIPHCIEVNDAPRGRLSTVARQNADREAACRAAIRCPIDYLLARPPALAQALHRLRGASPPGPLRWSVRE